MGKIHKIKLRKSKLGPKTQESPELLEAIKKDIETEEKELDKLDNPDNKRKICLDKEEKIDE